MKYLFHTHSILPGWRLVVREDMGMPAATTEDEWTITRSRLAADTNPDVRKEVDEKGWCLFKLVRGYRGRASAKIREALLGLW
jgi:hypothetical protein